MKIEYLDVKIEVINNAFTLTAPIERLDVAMVLINAAINASKEIDAYYEENVSNHAAHSSGLGFTWVFKDNNYSSEANK